MFKILVSLFFIFICSVVYAENAITDGKSMALMDVYKEGFNEGHKKGYDKGYFEGYKQAVEDFKVMFNEKLAEYKALEAGKFLLKNWYISYPKVYQVTTEKGVELIVEGCSIMRPFDDLSEKVFNIAPFKSSVFSFPSSSGKVNMVSEKSLAMQTSKKVSKKYIQDIQKLGLKYVAPIEQDYVVVFFDSEKSAEKFCVMYGCMQ